MAYLGLESEGRKRGLTNEKNAGALNLIAINLIFFWTIICSSLPLCSIISLSQRYFVHGPTSLQEIEGHRGKQLESWAVFLSRREGSSVPISREGPPYFWGNKAWAWLQGLFLPFILPSSKPQYCFSAKPYSFPFLPRDWAWKTLRKKAQVCT